MPGTLKHVSGERIELKIYEEGSIFSGKGFSRDPEIKILHGTGFNEHPNTPRRNLAITLYKLMLTRENHGNFEVIQRTYSSEFALLGNTLFKNEEDICFDEITVHIDQLEKWLQTKPFESQAETNESKNIRSIKVRFELKNDIEHRIENENLNFLIGSTISMNSKNNYREIQLGFTPNITVKPDKASQLEYYISTLSHIRSLLSLLTGEPVYFNSCTGKFFRGAESSEYAQIIFRETRKEPRRKWHAHQIMMPYSEIDEKFSEILEKWFSKKEKLESVSNLLMSNLYAIQKYTEIEFFRLINALEECHRRLIDEGRKNLKTRLSEVFSRLPQSLKLLITDSEDKLIIKIVDSRNYYFHRNAQDKSKAFTPEELYDANKKLEMLFFILLFTELSIEDEHIERALKRNSKFFYNPSSKFGEILQEWPNKDS